MASIWPAFVDAGAVACVAALGIVARVLWRLSRNLGQMVEDWRGVPGRPGVARVPGVMERLGSLEEVVAEIAHEVRPNSGTSMRDSIGRIHEATTGTPDPGVQP